MNHAVTGRTDHKEILEVSMRGYQTKRQWEFMVCLKAVLAGPHLITAREI